MNTIVLSRVRGIFADVFSLPEEQITSESSPDTIKSWDSLQHLNLILAMEQEFGVQFIPEEIERLLSVKHIIELLADKLHPATSSS